VPILKLILRRLALGVLTLFIVSVAVFALSQVLPSDPARAVLGREATDEGLAAFREKFGLDKPAVTQYTDWLTGMLKGEPGLSYSNGQPVMSFLGDRIKNSLFLMTAGSLISIPLSLVVGSYAALRRDKWFDNTNSVTSLILASMP
jgi:peptide/nickel transport system permease protein